MSIVTCHSPGCGNDGIPIELSLASADPETGVPIEVSVVMCGGCGEQITDIADA